MGLADCVDMLVGRGAGWLRSVWEASESDGVFLMPKTRKSALLLIDGNANVLWIRQRRQICLAGSLLVLMCCRLITVADPAGQ